MVVVPGGSLMMGSPKGEKWRVSNEGPRHKVTVAKAFAVGRYEVTFDEWDACAADGGCRGYKPKDKGWGRGSRPVINVSWDDAKAYVRWHNGKVGGSQYKLLSEAEWEYAARAGTTTPFWWGSTISTDQANYNGNYTYYGPKGDFRQKTVAVNSFKPNGFGLYNVHGNVWEWVEDRWNNDYKGAPTDGSARQTRGCSRRVIRGGSWSFFARYLRAAYRDGKNADYRNIDFGFRLSRTVS